jgi:3-oxoacyl-[acyl-carrier-protein] synthase II
MTDKKHFLTKSAENHIPRAMNARVVITGLGALTPLGNSMEEAWIKLLDGSSGIGRITRFDASAFVCRIAGELKGFDPRAYLTAKEAHKTDPFIQYALAAALMAVEDSGLSLLPQSSFRIGVLVGSGRGGVITSERNTAALLTRGPRPYLRFIRPCRSSTWPRDISPWCSGPRGPASMSLLPARRGRTPWARP